MGSCSSGMWYLLINPPNVVFWFFFFFCFPSDEKSTASRDSHFHYWTTPALAFVYLRKIICTSKESYILSISHLDSMEDILQVTEKFCLVC